MNLERWSTVADQNNASAPDGMPEGWPWSKVNDAFRETLAGARRWYGDAEWLRFVIQPVSRLAVDQVSIEGVDWTAEFIAGARVRVTAGATIVDMNVVSSAFSLGDTIVTVDGEVPLGCDGILLHVARTLGSAAFRAIGPNSGQIPLASQVRALSVGDQRFQTTLGSDFLVDTTVVSRVPILSGQGYFTIPGANGVNEQWLTVDLLARMHWRELATLQLHIYVGPLGTSFDTRLGLFRHSNTDGPTDETTSAGIHKIAIPNFRLGTLSASDRVSIHANLAAGFLSTVILLGSAFHLRVRRQFS